MFNIYFIHDLKDVAIEILDLMILRRAENWKCQSQGNIWLIVFQK